VEPQSPFVGFAEVALPVPLPQTFSYGIPEPLARAGAGSRVRVRFGTRSLIGCIVGIQEKAPDLPRGVTVKPISALLDLEPVLSASQLALARFIADYYLAPPGLVCRSMLPPETPSEERVVYQKAKSADSRVERGIAARILDALSRPITARAVARAVGRKSVASALAALVESGLVERKHGGRGGARTLRVARITEEGSRALAQLKLRPTASRILTLLSTATDPVPVFTIRNELDLPKSLPLRSLEKKRYIEIATEEYRRSPWGRLRSSAVKEVFTLTPAQREAMDAIRRAIASGEFHPFVLRGVTGSGKTEVYLGAAEVALARGRSVLMLVPEIALTPRLGALLHARFGERVAILHSALGAGERRDEWWRIRQGEARVVVGARAAVLAPVERLGLVVVDEEHESSYKQEESPRYSARDVAIVRARNDGAVAILGSATPSLESYSHAVEGRYRLLTLPDRIGARPLARVTLLDMRKVVREEGPEVVISRPLREALGARLEDKEQAMVLLNRRGYAGQLLCRQCGIALQCSECSVAMTLHRRATLAVCHYCGLGRATPERCQTCGGEYLRQVGYGTERVEEILKSLFPQSRVARMDRDTMRRKGSHEALLSRFASREVDLLVGTQMLAKGHDFPAVTLVGVLAADSGLATPDFRAAERTFQLLTQVAGRAGRGEREGEVLIQAFAPEHYSLGFARAQDFEGFFESERKFRRALHYPPVVSLVNLVVEGDTMAEASTLARRAASALKKSVPEDVKVLGPAFAVRSKIAGRYRSQILLKIPRREHARGRAAIRAMLRDEALLRATMVDVDPTTLT
jgi:primosomal protein N' (replication factor Y)